MTEALRLELLRSLIGKPWVANAKGPDAYDCWHLTKHVEKQLFERCVPEIIVPEVPTWPWMIEQFTEHSELKNWVECPYVAGGIVNASDGAIVLMARYRQPAHCGVWLQKERGVIHAEERDGVTFMDLTTLRSTGWAKLRFYEPRV